MSEPTPFQRACAHHWHTFTLVKEGDRRQRVGRGRACCMCDLVETPDPPAPPAVQVGLDLE